MDRGDRTSLENWIEYNEYEASRAEIEGDDWWGDADTDVEREIAQYCCSNDSKTKGEDKVVFVRRQKTRYQDVVFGYAGTTARDMEEWAELIIGGEKNICQLAIELYDWAKADEAYVEPTEVAVSDESWDWMKAVCEREIWYERQYGAMLFDKCSTAWRLPVKKLKNTATIAENAYSQTLVGDLFYYGTKEPRGKWKAFIWYQKASLWNYAPAQYRLGNCYYYGEGIVKNETKAVEWWQSAAKKSYDKAMARMGYQAMLDGKYKIAMHWFTRAAEQEYPLAQAWIGILHEHGLGVAKDREEAKAWFKKAAHNGLIEAQVWMERHSEAESVDQWRSLVIAQQAKNTAEHKRLHTARRSYRDMIADSVMAYARERGNKEELEKLGKRGTVSVWWYALGWLVFIALFIKGCM